MDAHGLFAQHLMHIANNTEKTPVEIMRFNQIATVLIDFFFYHKIMLVMHQNFWQETKFCLRQNHSGGPKSLTRLVLLQ